MLSNRTIPVFIILLLIFSNPLYSQHKLHKLPVKIYHRFSPSNEGFAFNNTGSNNGNFIKFNLGTPGTQNIVSPFTGHTFYGADFNLINELYAIDAISGSSVLYKVDTASGNITLIGNAVISSGQKMTGLTYDSSGNKWYAVSTDGATSTLYIVNITTGGLVFIGNIQGSHSVVGISAAPGGTLFGIDNASDSLIKINKFTALPTAVGAVGEEIATNIGMDFNPGTGTLYVSSNTPVPHLLSIDTTSGTGTALGNISGTVLVTGFAVPFSGQIAPPPSGLCQPFATSDFPPTGWEVSAGNQFWIWNTGSANCLGDGSAEYDFYDSPASTVEDLISGTFGAANGVNDSLIMQEAYASYQGEVDQLVIKTSTDTGNSWTTLITLNGGTSGPLVTAPPTTEQFLPDCTQWQRLAFKLPAGTKRVEFEAVSAFGNNLYLDSICIAEQPIGIHNIINEIPSAFKLHQNYPNPFNPETKITFDVAKSSNVKITIYNILGEQVQVLNDKLLTPGSYNFTWNAASYSSGIYFYKVEARPAGSSADEFTDTKKMMLIK